MTSSPNHLGQNPLTQQWVIYAPERSQRPGHSQQSLKPAADLPPKDNQCPFCPGNETMLPAVIDELASDDDGWLTRVVPNKFPALTPNADSSAETAGLYQTMPAFGVHEVVIETPYHNRDLPMLPAEHIEQVLKTYLRRNRCIREQHPEITAVIIFRNHGPASGTSLIHPHSQIIATAVVPKYIRDKEAVARTYFNRYSRCLLCDIIESQRQENIRCIYENSAFTAFIPFAAEVPFEIWIAPKRHHADFAQISEQETSDLADMLKNILSALCDRLNDPDYNYIIHSCSAPHCKSAALHWYLQIRPRTVTPAGFEIGSGVYINPSLPEDNAAVLKIT